MSRDSKLKIGILIATVSIGGVLALCNGLRFPWTDGIAPFAIVLTLGPCAAFYHRRKVDPFVMSLMAVMQMLVFTACFTVLMYSVAAIGAPAVDQVLIDADAALGIHVPVIVEWAQSRPWVYWGIGLIYDTVIPQTFIIIVLLGFQGDRKPLEQFVLRTMVALLITVAIFSVMPAKGPFATFGLDSRPTQQRYLDQFEQLRAGEMTAVSLRDTEGLVTFPSFHTTWAILLACAFWHRKKFFVPFAVLNALVIVGTLTTGWHYFVDVLGGVAVAVITIILTNRLRPWLDRGRGSTTAENTTGAEAAA